MQPAPYADIFVGNGEMAELMRRHDWAATSLGPPERWPEVSAAIQALMPVASQALLTVFGDRLAQAAQEQLGAEVARLTGSPDAPDGT